MKGFSFLLMLMPLQYMAGEIIILKGYESGGFEWWLGVLLTEPMFANGIYHYVKK